MVLWGLSNEILWPRSVESSSYFRLIEQVSYQLVVFLCSPILVVLRVCSYDSVTYGMLKSLCKVTFNMYQGAVARNIGIFL
jgi:hypothetical protein